jgi:voltage-gated sodium channel
MSQFETIVKKTTVRTARASTGSQLSGTPLVRFVKSRSFVVAFACLIIVSTVLIGIETQVLSSLSYGESGSEQVLAALSAANHVLTFLFTLEMVARLYVFRLDFFAEERMWNCFDLIILLLALVEVALELAVHVLSGRSRTLFDNGGTAKILRLFRLTRLLRLVRTFRQLKPLRMLVHSIIFAGKSVFWALMLLFMIVYAFGIVLTQAVMEYTEGGRRVEDEDLDSYYGSLYRSMLSLWMAVSGGISWIELTEPLERIGNTTWIALFLLYVIFVYFFILNVVTGVFVQNAFEGAQQDLDLTIEAQLREKQLYVDRLRLLFHEMNQNSDAGDGLTAAELNLQLDKPKVQSWFKALDVDTKQTWKLWEILDADNSGRVPLDDFIEGCLRLRGPATRVDVESLKWEIRGAAGTAEQSAERLAWLIENPGSPTSKLSVAANSAPLQR